MSDIFLSREAEAFMAGGVPRTLWQAESPRLAHVRGDWRRFSTSVSCWRTKNPTRTRTTFCPCVEAGSVSLVAGDSASSGTSRT